MDKRWWKSVSSTSICLFKVDVFSAGHIDRILFRSQDLSEVKAYCRSSWTKLLDGRVSLQDFIFAKEVKLGKYRLAVVSSDVGLL